MKQININMQLIIEIVSLINLNFPIKTVANNKNINCKNIAFELQDNYTNKQIHDKKFQFQ